MHICIEPGTFPDDIEPVKVQNCALTAGFSEVGLFSVLYPLVGSIINSRDEESNEAVTIEIAHCDGRNLGHQSHLTAIACQNLVITNCHCLQFADSGYKLCHVLQNERSCSKLSST